MDRRVVFALATTLLFTAVPFAAADKGPSDANPPMITINHLAKYCTTGADGKQNCGPTFYVDWDGKVYKETNKKLGLQRRDTLDGATLRPADARDLLA